jgi:hypothetical protein
MTQRVFRCTQSLHKTESYHSREWRQAKSADYKRREAARRRMSQKPASNDAEKRDTP